MKIESKLKPDGTFDLEGIEVKDADKFKSAQALGLTEDQRCALIQTLGLLEAGKLDHNYNGYTASFDMGSWGGHKRYYGCGSVCCIGGTAEVLAGYPLFGGGEVALDTELRNVFYPPRGADQYGVLHKHAGWSARPDQAARVLRHYLNTGKGDWSVM